MKIFLLLFLMLVAATGAAQQLRVRVENIKDDKGQIGVAIYNIDKDFLKKELTGKFVPAKKGEVEVVFENLPSGDYALSVMHDSNTNGKIDTNLVGIPKEGFGFSNNVIGTFGPPSFDKAKIKAGVGLVVIKLRY